MCLVEFMECCDRRQHFVEYLVSVVYQAGIDPLPILDLTDCVQELRRRGIPLPERGPWDTDPIYREMCQNVMSDIIESSINTVLIRKSGIRCKNQARESFPEKLLERERISSIVEQSLNFRL